MPISEQKMPLLEAFLAEEANHQLIQQIIDNQNAIMNNWEIRNKLFDFDKQQIILPNSMVGKSYTATLNLKKEDFRYLAIENLTEKGLDFNAENQIITGTPIESGDFKLALKFNFVGESENELPHTKMISLVINPDPKSLWKNIESNIHDPYWKKDDITACEKLGEKHIVVASKRGRSHANIGSFRDDDFAFRFLAESGWAVVAVADGAGSASLARQGSKIACQSVIEYFKTELSQDIYTELDTIIAEYSADAANTQKKLSAFIFNYVAKAAFYVHQNLEKSAKEYACALKDLNSTLIFSLLKKYEFGYAVLSFGVGDCPIALLNKDETEIKLMNWLDVGEFGGGTRFITMPEIFKSDKFYTRFGFKLIEDFSYLMLMTDGIYDPKFVVEANLEKIEKWQEFLQDLRAEVEFNPENMEIETQLSTWMDFWSPGNHDDRTLAVIF